MLKKFNFYIIIKYMKRFFLLGILVIIFLGSCEKSNETEKNDIQKEPEISNNNGGESNRTRLSFENSDDTQVDNEPTDTLVAVISDFPTVAASIQPQDMDIGILLDLNDTVFKERNVEALAFLDNLQRKQLDEKILLKDMQFSMQRNIEYLKRHDINISAYRVGVPVMLQGSEIRWNVKLFNETGVSCYGELVMVNQQPDWAFAEFDINLSELLNREKQLKEPFEPVSYDF